MKENILIRASKGSKITIRASIFETNSSSSHSFSMGPEGKLSGKLSYYVVDKDYIIHIDGDYWQEVLKTNEADEKLSYLLTYAYTLHYDPENETIWETYFNKIKETVLNHTGCTDLIYKNNGSTVDHQSLSLIDSRDILNPEFIKEFVFNPDTWVYFLWDSDCEDESFFEHSKKPLFTLKFDLPGLEEPIEITFYQNDTLYNLDKIFDEIYYYPETKTFGKERINGCLSHSVGFFFRDKDFLLTPTEIKFYDN